MTRKLLTDTELLFPLCPLCGGAGCPACKGTGEQQLDDDEDIDDEYEDDYDDGYNEIAEYMSHSDADTGL